MGRARSLAVVGGLLAATVVAVVPAQAASTTYLMGTGDGPTKDAGGQVWAARSGFVGGRLTTAPPRGTVIKGTQDQSIYRNSMFGFSGWNHSVSNGTYQVTLRMVDTWFGGSRQRQFNVTAEGRAVLSNVDIAASVGKYAAYNRIFDTKVTDGTLNLGFQEVVNHSTVSAIRLVQTAQAPTTPSQPAGMPGPSNTGVPAGTVLHRHDGDMLLNVAGATYSNLDVHGRVRIAAPNITLRNSIVRGNALHAFGSLVDVNNPGSNHSGFTLINSELVPAYPSIYQDAILGHDYTVIGSNIHGTVDAIKIVGNNVSVRGSWLHDTLLSGLGGGQITHNDGVQVLVGTNISITGNHIERNNNSGMQVTQDDGRVSNLTFSGNWADGGGCVVNLAHKPFATMSGITVTNNRFYHHERVANCAIVSGPATALRASGNIWGDTGAPVVITRGM